MRNFALNRYALSVGAATALLAACSGSQPPIATSPSGAAPLGFAHHVWFSYTGGKQTFQVPSGVTRIRVIAAGASGGGKVVADGGRVSAVIPVTPSETLAIYVGGAGTSSAGGFNGGGAGGPTVVGYGAGGYGGGGASDVREGGTALDDRVVVAGGAGGEGYATYGKRSGRGGQGGALTGGSGKAGCCKHFGNGGDPGTGGTQYQGGSGGKGVNQSGENGQFGYGGVGGSGCEYPSYCGYNGGGGGGGGGGYYGGGGGGGGAFFGCCGSGDGGGGGGGSSHVESSASDVHLQRGSSSADGNVVIRW